MPYSLVLNLLPSSPIPTQFLTGRHLHALFLKLVSAVDTDLSAYLHDQANEKAFTLSPLQVSKNEVKNIKIIGGKNKIDALASRTLQWEYKQPIRVGTPIWWRISLLDDSLFARLTQLWLHLNFDRPWHLGPADLHITNILTVPQLSHPWVNTISYAQLYEQASAETRQIIFSFCTPTNFRQGQYDTPMPTRETIFGSLLNRWNKYSNISLDRTLIEPIFTNFFDIHTEILADSRSKFIGCVGEVSYRIMGDVDPLKIKQINALADFALYSGVGRKTPMGMGMVRRLQELSKVNGYRM
ncbi:CRISPR-associated endoribonuclease Cas6 [Kamptonema sp. UHCC 0994]|uniref:CRISPR-associated endoribonuclease Cas6 n=1 Tax=Kamptonema sp. UHCC 0994 TaxID=3031329 RepID=UPI0023B95E2F|nr:CRISPR-associated endoribonuclease Cas6 [Kamptonema sp. UHCC 0994]MDF0554609.1 CRISPR-associated endoribonuclease Cas6 [Kamptonema sp. UHCC 0994]